MAMASAFFIMAFPNAHVWFAIAAMGVAWLSASQDLLLDGLRLQTLKRDAYGVGASIVTMSYRVAMICTGGRF